MNNITTAKNHVISPSEALDMVKDDGKYKYACFTLGMILLYSIVTKAMESDKAINVRVTADGQAELSISPTVIPAE